MNPKPLDMPPAVQCLIDLYRAMVDEADPARVVPAHLPPPPAAGRTVVVGLGKAAASMARALEAHWPAPLEGVVAVPTGCAVPLRRLRVIEGSHPVPDERSVVAAQALLDAVSGLGPDDLVIALISGGGSAVCALPAAGLTLQHKQRITRELLACGATIDEINTVRRHLSAFKGGRLALQAWPATVVSLVISDIPGDDATLVASGPTAADDTTCADALALLRRYRIEIPAAVHEGLQRGRWETPKTGDPRLQKTRMTLVADAWRGLQAAAELARRRGVRAHVLSDAMEGEAKDLARAHAALALSVATRGEPFQAPCVLLSGGEATVTLRDAEAAGSGGRNTEFALALAMALDRRPGTARIHALSAGTDGIDGRAGAAGAWIVPGLLDAARRAGLDARASLDRNDSATLLGAMGCLLSTGPTLTNVNDFRAVFIEAPR
ncbi:glycerate kinase type-2 family protein [Aquabacterium humicola]|uniref:glycerate kinase type-2 family protein n=1 Tax=Aquabacterium humicola TaxID=3237377 RepID=UPI002543923A|nr:glycerate kinase [Rubrivivax pictus]